MKTTRRKLQFAGNSSYVLTLPKQWITQVNLNVPKSEVIIEELDDSSLRIFPATLSTPERTSQTLIQVDKNSKPEEIIRLILAGYLASKSQITIQTIDETPLPPDFVIQINDICDKLWGSEIIEESIDKIIIHDALNPAQMKIVEIVRKAWFTAKNMLGRALIMMFEDYQESSKLVIGKSERTLDKLYYLALRQLYHAASSVVFATEIGIYPSEIIDYHFLIKNIERIGDHSEQLVKLGPKKISNKKAFQTVADLTKKACEDAIISFLQFDENLAQDAINQKTIINKHLDKIEVTLDEFLLYKSLSRLADYASDIGELVLNRIFTQNKNSKNVNL